MDNLRSENIGCQSKVVSQTDGLSVINNPLQERGDRNIMLNSS